jgi:hypothetical protein
MTILVDASNVHGAQLIGAAWSIIGTNQAEARYDIFKGYYKSAVLGQGITPRVTTGLVNRRTHKDYRRKGNSMNI